MMGNLIYMITMIFLDLFVSVGFMIIVFQLKDE